MSAGSNRMGDSVGHASMVGAYGRALRRILEVRERSRAVMSVGDLARVEAVHQSSSATGRIIRMSAIGRAPLVDSARLELLALPAVAQATVCDRVVSLLATHGTLSSEERQWCRSVADSCKSAGTSLALLEACLGRDGILGAVRPHAVHAVTMRIEPGSPDFGASLTPKLRKHVLIAFADVLRARGFRSDDVAWVRGWLETCDGNRSSEAIRGEASDRRPGSPPFVMAGLHALYARLLEVAPGGEVSGGVGLLRLLQSLRLALRGTQMPLPPPSLEFEAQLRRNVSKSFREAARHLLSIAAARMGVTESIRGRVMSDQQRLQSRIDWVERYVSQATDLVIWCPSEIFHSCEASFRDSGLVESLAPATSARAEAETPMFLRLDFRKGFLCLPLQRKSMQIEFRSWPSGMLLPVSTRPEQLRLAPRVVSDVLPSHLWQTAASEAIRYLM